MTIAHHGLLMGAASASVGSPPTAITGGTSWVDFTDISSIYIDDTPTNVSADGDRIYFVKSKVNTLLGLLCNGVSTTRPTYKTNVVNGKSVARTDGSDDNGAYKFVASFSGPAAFSSSSSFALTSAYTTTAKTVVMALAVTTARANSGNTFGNDMIFGDGANNRCVVACYNIDASNVMLQWYSYDGATKTVQTSIPKATFVIASMTHDGTNLKIRINHGSWVSTACGTTNTMTGQIEYASGFGTKGNFDMAHAATWNTVVSDADIYLVEQYFADALGITLTP